MFSIFNLLTSVSEGANDKGKDNGWVIWVILGVVLVGMLAMNFFSNKKRREQMEAEKEKRNAIRPGFKEMTIGGIVGTVVAVDDEANTFVLQTGTDEVPNYIKFDKVAIYSSEDPNAPVETEAEATEKSEEAKKAEEDFSDAAETNAEAPETPAEVEQATEEAVKEEKEEEKAEEKMEDDNSSDNL
mgnify:CR=1 FL=1